MPQRDPHRLRIAVVGAGVAGLAWARELRGPGIENTVFEKSRGLGGRPSPRRVDKLLGFDHGVRYVTAQSAVFASRIREAIEAGTADIWMP